MWSVAEQYGRAEDMVCTDDEPCNHQEGRQILPSEKEGEMGDV
jgi:hypothetical protein